MTPLITHADVSSWDKGLKFVQNLHQHTNFVYASSEGTGMSVHLACTSFAMPLLTLLRTLYRYF